MASRWLQLIIQFLVMFAIYAVIVFVLATFGVGGFWPQMAVALLVAFGYPAVLRRLGREPAIWKRVESE